MLGERHNGVMRTGKKSPPIVLLLRQLQFALALTTIVPLLALSYLILRYVTPGLLAEGVVAVILLAVMVLMLAGTRMVFRIIAKSGGTGFAAHLADERPRLDALPGEVEWEGRSLRHTVAEATALIGVIPILALGYIMVRYVLPVQTTENILLLSVFIIAVLILGMQQIRRLTKRILAVAADARLVSLGSGRHGLDGGGDEIGKLSMDLDRIASKLSTRSLELRQTKAFIEHLPHPLLVVDMAGTVGLANAAATGLLGYSDDELGGTNMGSFFAAGGEADRLLAEEGTGELETVWVRKDGSRVPVSVRCGLLSRDGSKYGLVLVATDLTERRLTERVNRRLAEIIRNTHDGVILTDARGRTTYVNPAFEGMTGHSGEELQGRDPADLIVADDAKAVGDGIRYAVMENGEWTGELLCRRKNGAVYPVETRVFAIRNAGGELVEIAAIQQDISERRRAESALRESEQRYRSLFMDSPISLWEEDLSEVKKHIDNLKNSGVMDFRRYFEKHPEEVGRCATMVKVVDVNSATLDLYGAESKEDLKDDLRRLFTVETYGTFREELVAIAEGKTSFQCDCVARTLKGATKYTRLSWSVSPGREDDFSKVLVSIVDITERKMAEEELLRYALVYRAMDEALVISTNDGVIIDVNPAAEKMCGWSRGELVGKKAGMINPPELADQIIGDINRGLEKEGVWRGEVPLLTKSGERRRLSTIVSYIRDPSGKKIGTIGINRDITEQKQLEERLRHAQKMEAVGLLAGGIAHDFNNVLAGIVGYASLLDKALGEESPLCADAKAIMRLSHRGADLTKALLAFARKGKYNPRSLNVNEIILETIKFIGETMGRGLEIRTELAAEIPNVLADEEQLRQVVMNLCINACEFMGGGGAMTVRSASMVPEKGFFKIHDELKKGPYVVFSIYDTGRGIDAETLRHIFEPFFSTKKQKTGTGLGLSTVIGIVEGHDGCIEVESKPGKGSTFTVYLPAIEEKSGKGDARRAGDARGTEEILVVDDEPDIRRSTRRSLEELGYTVYEAADGNEALEILGHKKDMIDLVILDMVMRGMRGAKTFGEMKKVAPNLPVIICTGYSTDITRQMLVRGASGIIQKPFNPDDLARRVRDILNR